MQEFVDRFLGLGLPTLPPVPASRLARLADELGAAVPEAVQQLYRAFGGVDPDGPYFPFRLMPPDEVVETRELLLEQAESLEPAPEACYFWADDNSNWAGVYVEGPLAGMVCYLDHDEPDDVPQYRSVSRFFAACIAAHEREEDWYEMPVDFPVPGPDMDAAERERDLARVTTFRGLLGAADEVEALRLLRRIVWLTPPGHTGELVEYLHHPSPWIQESACHMMGLRDHHPAIDRLAEIIRADKANNPVIASIGALGRMTSPKARAVLETLKDEVDDGFDIYFDEALGD